MPRVLVVGKDLDLCEAHIFAGLSRMGVSIHVLMDPSLNHADILKSAGAGVSALKMRSRLDVIAIRELRNIIREAGFDIVHCLTNRAISNTLIASYGLPVKRVAYRGTMGHLSRFDPFSWLAYLNPGIHRIVCVSEAVCDYLRLFLPADRLVTIYKGHDVSWYRAEAGVTLGDFGVPDGAFVVACVANMRPVKGVPYLIEAFRGIPRGKNIHLLLVGRVEDSEVTRLMSDPEVSGRIHLTGFQSNAPAIVSRCQVFVMPSVKREGLPKALLEAMATGVAPIVSAVGGMPEVVVDGECGLVVPPRDGPAIADAVTRLYENPEEAAAFGRAARTRVIECFNVKKSIEETFRVYQELSTTSFKP